MNNNEILKRVEVLTQVLESKQREINEKTKDAEAYKIGYDKLSKIVRYVVSAFLIVFLSALLLIGYVVHKHYQYESSITSTVEEHVKELDSDNGGVIINESPDVKDVTGSGTK